MPFNLITSTLRKGAGALKNTKVLGLGAVLLGGALFGSTAYAGFNVGSVGSAKSLTETPSADVFGNSLDNLINGVLSTEDLTKAGLTFSACGTDPLPTHILDYLETILDSSAADTSDWQNDIDGITDCDQDGANWKIGQINDNTSGHSSSDLTVSMLDDAIELPGYTNNLLSADSSKTIADIQAFFPAALSSVTTSSIKTLIAETVVGFDSQAHATAYHNNANRAGFTLAQFEACYNSTNSFTPGANQCTISKDSWDAIEGVQNVADNSSNQLTASLISGGLALKSVTANADLDTSNAVHLRYLEDCISGESDAITALETCNNGFTLAKANLFYVSQIAGAQPGYPTSALTIAMLEAAGMTSGANTVVGATLAQLQSNITTSGLTKSSTTTNINDWVTVAAGFGAGTTYSGVSTATTNGWTVANYKTASSNGGWSNSSAHKTSFDSCLSDTSTGSGGASTCSISRTSWTTLESAIAIAGGGGDNLTATDVTTLLALSSTSANASYDNSSSVHLDYLSDCISGASDVSSEISTCMNALTVPKVSVFNIKKIADGSYGTSGLTANLLVSAGAFNDNSTEDNVSSGNFCGTNGTSSCEAYLRTQITSASSDNVSSASNINDWVGSIISANMQTVLNSSANDITANNSAAGCTLSVPINIPYYCDWYGGWISCTVSASDNFTLTDTNSNGYDDAGTLDASSIFSGKTASYSIAMSSSWTWPSFSKTKTSSIALTSYTGSDGTYSYIMSEVTGTQGLDDICSGIPSGYQMATYEETLGIGNPDNVQYYWPWSGTASGSGWADHCYAPSWQEIDDVANNGTPGRWGSLGNSNWNKRRSWRNYTGSGTHSDYVSICKMSGCNTSSGWDVNRSKSGEMNRTVKISTHRSGTKKFYYRSKTASGCPSS